MKSKDLRGNHLPNTHGLKSDEYVKLVNSRTELRQFKKATGFTDKVGQCGNCMKVFQSPKHLLQHRRKMHIRRSVALRNEKIDQGRVSF